MESNWNFEKDLELVKQKLFKCSPAEKHKIQSLITEILEASLPDIPDAPGNLNSTTEACSNDTQGKSQSVPTTPELLNLDTSVILNVIRLMHQFKRDFQGTRKLLDDTEIKNTVAWKLFQTTSWAQLQNLWNVFSFYVHKTVESNESTGFQPKFPLKVDVILQQLFGHLPTKDLLNCRLVSRAWNEKLMHWEFPKRQKCGFTLSFDKIVPIMESNITSPFIFSNLTIYLAGMATDKCNWFFTNYGAYVKTLNISAEHLKPLADQETCRNSSLFEFIYNLRTIFQNVNQMQNLRIVTLPEAVLQEPFIFTPQELKTFTLPTVRSLGFNLSCDFSTEFSEGFFAMLHNLKSLHIVFRKPTNELQQVLDGIQKLKLNSLTLDCRKYSRANLWTSLQTQNLKMLRTDLYFESDENVASLEKFIQSQSQTLETFKIARSLQEPDRNTRMARLPIAHNLDILALASYENCHFEAITPRQLPKLRSASFDFSKISENFVDGVFTTVQELSNYRNLHRVVLKVGVEDWKNLASRFPNVKRLSVNFQIGGKAASELFRCFPNLEYLDLTVVRPRNEEVDGDNGNINLLLSGVTPERHSFMFQLLDTLKSSKDLLQIEPAHPSLRNLKKLKELRLDIWNVFVVVKTLCPIDYVGLHLGLMSIQPLDRLSIFGYFKISEDGAESLKNYHRNVVIAPTSILPSSTT